MKVNLTATVSHLRNAEKNGAEFTKVLLTLGKLHVAHASIGGWATPEQALTEFGKAPGRFTFTPAFKDMDPKTLLNTLPKKAA